MLKKRLTVIDLRRLLEAAEKEGYGDLEVKFKVEKERCKGNGYTMTVFSIHDYSIECITPAEKENFFLNFFEE